MTPLFVYHERGEDDTQIELYIMYGTRFSGVYHKWGGESPEGNFMAGNSSREILPKEILPKEILRGKLSKTIPGRKICNPACVKNRIG